MIQAISAVEGFGRIQRIDGVDRVRQRISEIENKFGIGNIGGEDFQSILNKELEKTSKLNFKPVEKNDETIKMEEIQNAAKTDKTKEVDEIETFTAAEDDKKSSKSTSEKSSKAVEPKVEISFPGEEALPDAMNKAINPFAAVASKPATPSERVDEEEIEEPTYDTKRLSATSSGLSTEDMIEAAAEKYDVDSRLVKAIAIAESNMNQDDISDAGAIGVMQLMPETARGLGVDPYDEQQNIEGGAKYIRQMLDTFNGNVRKAVAAYNAGPGAVQRYGGIPPYGETQHYVGRVMDLYR